MLRRVALTLTLLIAIAASATQRSEKTLGLAGGFNTANDGAVAGVFFQYSFSSHFRLAPSADYVFRHRGIDGLHVNLNCQFPIGVGSVRRLLTSSVSTIEWSYIDIRFRPTRG